MKNKTNLKTINWSILIIVVLTAVITAIITIYDLYNTPAFGEDAPSSAGFRWGTLHIIISIAILFISVFLAIGWKRLFPFNVPISIILVGFCYVLFFLTFTIGWRQNTGHAWLPYHFPNRGDFNNFLFNFFSYSTSQCYQ